MEDVLAIILGGGRGTRLYPLTLKRSKPAVPIGGKYRLIDIPISNCLNSNLRRMFVLTQFNSESLNKHIALTYNFDIFSSGFVSVLAAEQTEEGGNWFQGTADAVRQSLRHMRRTNARDILILSGDQLYQMDYRQMLRTHRDSGADATVGVIPVAGDQASQFGILKMDPAGRIVHFDEKPPADRLPLLVSKIPAVGDGYLASMGIYIFKRQVLEQALANPQLVDFGRHVIPDAVPRARVQAHVHQGYWEDVGTIQSYFQANLALCESIPPFDFYDAAHPIYTHPRFLPASKIERCTIHNALISEGCILNGADIDRAVIGIRSRIGSAVRIRNSLLIGADEYETLDEMVATERRGVPPIGIGSESIVENAIIDKNARIGRGVKIVNESGTKEMDGDGFFIREGLVIVPKNGVVSDGTVI
ncbi:MAG TPA: glucose-1-phosphate adenylyltransferase [Polyangia bacterium]|jgi:glucose-1-phosphate adenylyltransferase|nr:glucose-1-phosphate adenylyltransferase [Polyangia bacterium]